MLIDTTSTPGAIDLLGARLAGSFAEPFPVAGQPMIVGASIGRATFPDDANSAEQLLSTADAAMFARKRDRPLAVHRP